VRLLVLTSLLVVGCDDDMAVDLAMTAVLSVADLGGGEDLSSEYPLRICMPGEACCPQACNSPYTLDQALANLPCPTSCESVAVSTCGRLKCISTSMNCIHLIRFDSCYDIDTGKLIFQGDSNVSPCQCGPPGYEPVPIGCVPDNPSFPASCFADLGESD
jgi:hypothetical protein